MAASGLISVFYTISEWVMRLLTINLLWITFNIPIAYLVINLIAVESVNELFMVAITIAVLLPFVFFPATTAMFAVTRKWVMKETDIRIIRSFLHYYKENYVRSMVGGLIIGAVWIIYVLDYYYFILLKGESFSSTFLFFLSIVFLIVFMFLLVFTFNFISYNVHINERLLKSIKEALIITIGNPMISISICGLNALIIYISFSVLTFLIPFFMGALIALTSFAGFYMIYLKMVSMNEATRVTNNPESVS